MKVYVNRSPVIGPWGGGNMWVQSAHSMFPQHDMHLVSLQEKPQTIFIAGINAENDKISAYDAIKYKNSEKAAGRDVTLIFRVNENDARKNTNDIDARILEIAKHVDHTVFVSNWLKDYFVNKQTAIKNYSVIYNGVDKELYRPGQKIKNGKINVVTHHWSDNFMKGFDIYERLDEWISTNADFTFTYIGRDRGTFKNTNVIKPLFGLALGEELRKYDVYVSASRFDPGPNHIIEAISCEIPTFVHKDGGGCVEFAGKNHVYDDFSSLLNMLSTKIYSPNEEWIPRSWNHCIGEFAELTKSITNEKHK